MIFIMQLFGLFVETSRSQDQRQQHLKPPLSFITFIITTHIDCCRRGIGHVFQAPQVI